MPQPPTSISQSIPLISYTEQRDNGIPYTIATAYRQFTLSYDPTDQPGVLFAFRHVGPEGPLAEEHHRFIEPRLIAAVVHDGLPVLESHTLDLELIPHGIFPRRIHITAFLDGLNIQLVVKRKQLADFLASLHHQFGPALRY